MVITEIGGTVGDIESLPFLEALRQFASDLGRAHCMFVHLTLVPFLGHAGELKTKPTQHSVQELRRVAMRLAQRRIRPAQVIAMITRSVQAGMEFRWFTADEEFGQYPGLRDDLETAGTAYVMAIPKNTEITDATGATTEVKNVPGQVSPNAWQRRSCGIGSKGYRVYDWAVIDTDDPDHQYLIRRSVDDGELAFYHCYNPRHEPLGELVRVAGTRWPIEECFQTGKGNVGLDNYQVRLYHAWYRHITFAMIGQSFLAVLAHRHRAKKGDLHPTANRPARCSPAPNPPTPPTPPPPPPPQPSRRRSAAGSA